MCLCKQERWALLLTLTSPFQLHFGINNYPHGVENNNNNKKKSAGEPKSCPAPAGAAPPPSSCHPEHRGSMQGGCLGQLIFFLALGRALPLSFFFFPIIIPRSPPPLRSWGAAAGPAWPFKGGAARRCLFRAGPCLWGKEVWAGGGPEKQRPRALHGRGGRGGALFPRCAPRPPPHAGRGLPRAVRAPPGVTVRGSGEQGGGGGCSPPGYLRFQPCCG